LNAADDHSWVSHCRQMAAKQIAQGLQTNSSLASLMRDIVSIFCITSLFCTQYIYSITCFPYSDVSQPLETILGRSRLSKVIHRVLGSFETILLSPRDSSQDSTDFTKCISFIATEYLPTLPTPMPSVASPHFRHPRSRRIRWPRRSIPFYLASPLTNRLNSIPRVGSTSSLLRYHVPAGCRSAQDCCKRFGYGSLGRL